MLIFRAGAAATSVRNTASVGFGQLRVPVCHFFSSHDRKRKKEERKKKREGVNKSEHGKSTSAYINLYPIKDHQQTAV
jgi:hypothetical protein